jgi:fibronectin-binding autotransporter adhesin
LTTLKENLSCSALREARAFFIQRSYMRVSWKTIAFSFLVCHQISLQSVTFFVNTNSDTGVGSLRDVIALANASPGSNIVINAGIGTIHLTNHLPVIGPNITAITTLVGSTTINGQSMFQALFVDVGVGSISLTGLAIQNCVVAGGDGGTGIAGGGGGMGAGGGLFVFTGDVLLHDVTFDNCKAFGGTGGPFSSINNGCGGGGGYQGAGGNSDVGGRGGGGGGGLRSSGGSSISSSDGGGGGGGNCGTTVTPCDGGGSCGVDPTFGASGGGGGGGGAGTGVSVANSISGGNGGTGNSGAAGAGGVASGQNGGIGTGDSGGGGGGGQTGVGNGGMGGSGGTLGGGGGGGGDGSNSTGGAGGVKAGGGGGGHDGSTGGGGVAGDLGGGGGSGGGETGNTSGGAGGFGGGAGGSGGNAAGANGGFGGGGGAAVAGFGGTSPFGGGSGGSINNNGSGGGGGGGGAGLGGAIFVIKGVTLTVQDGVTLGLTQPNLAQGGSASAGGTAGQGLGNDTFLMSGATLLFDNSVSLNFDKNIISDLGAGGGTGGGVVASGAGLVILGGAQNDYTGSTTVNAGATLQVAIDQNLGVATNPLNLNSGKFQVSSSFTSSILRTMNLTGTDIVNTFANTLTWPGIIQGAGNLIVQGSTSGVFIPTASNLYSGTTQIDPGGTIQISAENNLGVGTPLILNGGTLRTSASLSITRAVSTLSPNSTVDTENFAVTISGAITGAGGLIKAGTGTLSLTVADAYAGPTTVNGGSLVLTPTGSLPGTSSVTLNAAGSNTLNLFGTNQLSGTTAVVINSGTFNMSNGTGPQTIGDLSGNSGTLVNLGANNLLAGTPLTPLPYNGVIQGTGSFTMQGTGKITLGGANTYSGGTFITAGTLALAGAGSLNPLGSLIMSGVSTFDISASNNGQTIGELISGSASATIILGGKFLTTNSAISSTFAGVIQGTGGLVKGGAGTLFLTGVNTYSGGTTINAGSTLALSAGGALNSAGAVTIAPGATFDISGASGNRAIGDLIGAGVVNLGANTLTSNTVDNVIYSGVIQGTGGFTKAAAGTLILLGPNTYSGLTTVTGGTLVVDTTSIPGNAVNNATLTFDQNFDATYGFTITGTGNLIKDGFGNLTTTGSITQNAVTLRGGAMTVDGPVTVTTTFTVDPGTTLFGTGPITGALINNGTVNPDDIFGTLNIVGSYVQNGTLNIQLSPTQNDLLNITGAPGTATLNPGSTLDVLIMPGSYPANATYTIVQTTGGVIGTFTNVVFSLPTFAGVVEYLPTGSPLDVVIVLTKTPFSQFSATCPNARAVATALDVIELDSPSSDMKMIIDTLRLLSASDLNTALNMMQPSIFKGLSLAQQENEIALQGTLSHHLSDVINKHCCSNRVPRSNVWIDTYGGWARQEGDSCQFAYHFNNYGAVAGWDVHPAAHYLLGAGLSYSHTDLKWSQKRGNGEIDSGHLLLYASWWWDHFYANLSGLGSYNAIHANRKVKFAADGFASIDRKAKHANRGLEALGHIDLGVPLVATICSVTPYVGGDYIFLAEDGYSEHGAGGIDLKVKGKHLQMVRGEAGLEFARCIASEKTMWLPRVKIGWAGERRFEGKSLKSKFKETPVSPEFEVDGIYPRNRSMLAVGGSMTGFFCHEKISVQVDYDGEFGHHWQNNRALLTLNFAIFPVSKGVKQAKQEEARLRNRSFSPRMMMQLPSTSNQ